MKLIDITPPDLACSVSMACPAVFKVVAESACNYGPSCPTVAHDASSDDYVIIGAIVEHPELAGRVDEGEKAAKISGEMLREALANV